MMIHQPVDNLLSSAIAEQIFPGAVLLAARSERVLLHQAYGTTMYADAGSWPVTCDTIFDIASLTKLFTATAVLCLLDAGLLDLDAEARRYLPGLRASGVNLRHLLTHTSGLELRLSLLREGGAASIRAAIYGQEPGRLPGSYLAYTNIGATILGEIISAVYGGPLDSAISELISGPLGMAATCFNPPATWHTQIAPSEWDDSWRKGLVQGVVHDESACALGGVAGHAGLFSTAENLLRFGRMWLAGGAFAGRQILREATVAAALRDYTWGLPSPTGQPFRAGLGWMIDRPFMGAAPLGSVGHTGFTGPIIVLCPANDSCLVMLCNRTYPRRTPPPYRHHAVMAQLCDMFIAGEP